jgi:hypothetical protein
MVKASFYLSIAHDLNRGLCKGKNWTKPFQRFPRPPDIPGKNLDPIALPIALGALIYLNANPDLSVYLARVEAAGGKVTVPKTQISPEIGYRACLTDTEGNRLALHSQA